MIKRRRRDGCVHVSWDTDYRCGLASLFLLLLLLLDSVVVFDVTPKLVIAFLVVIAPASRSTNRLRPQMQHSTGIHSIAECYLVAAP